MKGGKCKKNKLKVHRHKKEVIINLVLQVEKDIKGEKIACAAY